MKFGDLINQVVTAIVIPILPAVAGYMIVWLRAKTRLLTSQIHNENVKNYLNLLDEVVADVVKAINQLAVDDLKSATSDGKLSKEDAAELKAKAVNQIKVILGERGNEALKEVYGDIDELISTRIEATVNTLKSK